MTRMKSALAALAMSVMAVLPAAQAQTLHVLGAGSSAQFLSAALGADDFAVQIASGSGGALCSFHWTGKNSANVIDNRSSLIQPELGNIWIVWTAACSDATGNTGVQDVWADISVDSTVGVRAFLAVNSDGSFGAQAQVLPKAAGDNLISPQSLWKDNLADVSLLTAPNVSALIGTSASGGAHINVGLTDIRPEDASYATTRALGTLSTTTWSGLGYKGANASIGAPIFTADGQGTKAVPIKFALTGTDPITHKAARSFTTVPLGAAPIIFVYNNNGAFDPNVVNASTGVGVTGTANKLLAHLFDGTTICDSHNQAFGGTGDGLGNPITVVLREPLSGTMNTTEFTVFRTFGNTSDSQEKGVINPFNSPYNPLNLGCPTHGHRFRAIGTGEVVNAIKKSGNAIAPPDANVIGYLFWGFANASKLTGASFQYLTLDGVDPIALPGTVNQQLPNCTGTTCPATLWTGGLSFPNLRNGTYKSWSLLRWVVPSGDVDPFGPTQLAADSQTFATNEFADYVAFNTAADVQGGLHLYRSHFKQSLVNADNGAVTGACTPTTACTLGGATEAGGDMGGQIEGPYPLNPTGTVSTLTTSATVTWKSGPLFIPNGTLTGCVYTSPEIGAQINITGVSNGPFTINAIATTGKTITVDHIPAQKVTAQSYSFVNPIDPTTPGVLCKKQ